MLAPNEEVQGPLECTECILSWW